MFVLKYLVNQYCFNVYQNPPESSVQILAWIELIFLIVAGMVLCFGFQMRVILITNCFSSCSAVLTLSQGLA